MIRDPHGLFRLVMLLLCAMSQENTRSCHSGESRTQQIIMSRCFNFLDPDLCRGVGAFPNKPLEVHRLFAGQNFKEIIDLWIFIASQFISHKLHNWTELLQEFLPLKLCELFLALASLATKHETIAFGNTFLRIFAKEKP